jgi:PIN like domain
MRLAFRHYFRPTELELTELWRDCLFVFDASVLLNIYGYSNDTRDELVRIITQNSARLRCPHQFGLEFARRRCDVITRQVKNYANAEEALKNIQNKHIAPKRDHPYLTKKSLRAYDAIQAELRSNRTAIEKLIGSDPYADQILAAFEGRVGNAPSSDELAELHAKAKERFEKSIPPGFADLKEKGPVDSCGDFIGWHQIIKIAESEQKGVVLVVDDLKEDWWQISGSHTIGPRPELVEEFGNITHQRIWMYTSENFLRATKKYLDTDIAETVIEEVGERLADQRRSDRQQKPGRSDDAKPLASEASQDNVGRVSASNANKPMSNLKPQSNANQDESVKPKTRAEETPSEGDR